ncbi:hypothetical protein DFH09DRAFT_574809 [Mycena vulgaris]|nr:hypothetical protein DFH09DRAFT_574809 [Mycena vulgaris]
MPSPEIRIKFVYEDSRLVPAESLITQKTNESLALAFRHVEALCGRKTGSLAFSYNRAWLEDADTPLRLKMEDGDTIQCVAVIKIAILHPNASTQIFNVDPRDVSVTFSMLFATYGTITQTNPALLQFTLNGTRLVENAFIVETLGVNDDGFVLVALPVDTGPDMGSTAVMISSPGLLPPKTLESQPTLETPQAMLLRVKTSLLTLDANWLGTLIHSWPDVCPPQDDDDIIWNFARDFMTWRDGVVHQAGSGLETIRDPGNFLTRQTNYITSLEQLHQEWKNESLEMWKARKSVQKYEATPIQQAIQVSASKRMLREARIISVLGLLIGAWKSHLLGGLSSLCSGPGLYSDFRILRECRSITGDQTIEDILGYRKLNTGASSEDLASSAAEDEGPNVDYRTIRRRQSARLRRQAVQVPSQAIAPKAPLNSIRLESPPARSPETRREIIQYEWNKIARGAGAAGLEFINDVDDEEVPPGIGILFPYVERSYLFDIGITETSPLVGCQCDGVVGCRHAGRCSCQADLEDGPVYTPQGLFKFNTESEIIECNSYCQCPPKCANRVAQFPRQVPVQIFKTEQRGWGARIPIDLVRGRVIGIYTGSSRREEAKKLSGSRASYCFDLDINEEADEEPPENAYSVDAFGCGNWTRFINHSCSPNLQIISVVYDTMPQDNIPYLVFVTTKNIPAYTELTFDYNPAHQIEFESKRFIEKTSSKRSKSKKHTACLCGTPKCRGWLSVSLYREELVLMACDLGR